MRVVALAPELEPAWADLFAASSSGCYCRYWHFEGGKNDWLARLAFAEGDNHAEQRALLLAGDDRARGVVALEEAPEPQAQAVAVGWMKLVPVAAVPKLRRLPVYRALSLGPEKGIWSVGCLLVRPTHRRRGVARALVLGAVAIAAGWGASAVEAYPHRRGEALRDEEAWMGPLSLFEECGFSVVGGDLAYPVLRRVIGR